MPLPDKGCVVGTWDISIPEGNYRIEFEHGSTSGKRVIWINGKVSISTWSRDNSEMVQVDCACRKYSGKTGCFD